MEENKTGVWIPSEYGTLVKLKQSSQYPINIKDRICIMSQTHHVTCEVKRISYCAGSTRVSHYYLKPVQSIYGSGSAALSPENTTDYLYLMFHFNSGTLSFDGDLIEEYLKCDYTDSHTLKVIILPKGQETMNERCEIRTGTIMTDKLNIDIVKSKTRDMLITIPNHDLGNSDSTKSWMPISNHIDPITATSEADKNFQKEYYWTFGAKRGLRSETPTLDNLSGEMNEIRKALKYQRETIEDIMNTLAETKKEKEMCTKSLKEMIKKPIFVDKEITVKEPMLDNDGKQIEKDGKPVFKTKHYHGMVKILWNCGAETVAYVEGNDVYDKENGFKTCVIKYLFGNADAHDAVDFWTNKYVKYPSSCIEVTENLCKLEEILEKDKRREEERKGLLHAKFLRRTKRFMTFDSIPDRKDEFYTKEDEKHIKEFKKLAKKYFPELKGKEIYVHSNKNDEVFVAIK